MSEKEKIKIRLNVENLGPHSGSNIINFEDEFESNKAVYFAPNGTGKTFISRAFRVAEICKELNNTNELLSLGQTTGAFSFETKFKNDSKTLNILFKKDNPPMVENNTDYIFHVFNQDYIEKNIISNNYNPNGDIDGYILGKEQIDLAKEKQLLKDLDNNINKIGNQLDLIVQTAKSELSQNGVVSTTTEYKALTVDNLRNNQINWDVLSYDVVKKHMDVFLDRPEKIEDINEIYADFSDSLIEEIQNVLETVYSGSKWDDEFVQNYKNNINFIEHGLDSMDGKNICPFCKQPLDVKAMDLIHKYNSFRQDKQAEVIARIQKLNKSLINFVESIKTKYWLINQSKLQLEEIKKYFPVLTSLSIDNIDISTYSLNCFDSLSADLKNKSNNISVNDFDTTSITLCKQYISSLQHTLKTNNEIIKRANSIKNNAREERLRLRKELCLSKFNECKDKAMPILNQEKRLKDQYNNLSVEIQEKENKIKVSKRDKVFETFETLMDLFFNGKYQLNKDTFKIVFKSTSLDNNAQKVLSDGEKSIVAYCHYLAMTHTLVKQIEDYEKLFFIIDDPVSSMDFDYVFQVAQTIKDIKSLFSIEGFERIWVFTHNAEFLSLLVRNNIIATPFSITPGKIVRIPSGLVLPYESHLQDIVNVSTGVCLATHTTANSIRHVIETVCKFEYPSKNMTAYITENEILSSNSCLNIICQDFSHGNIRKQYALTAEQLKNACCTVVEFFKKEYPGQIEAIKKIN